MNMKCVCGYEYIREPTPSNPKKGDEPFIVLKDLNGGYAEFQRYVRHFHEYEKYQLYMCPKCGTIRGERSFG